GPIVIGQAGGHGKNTMAHPGVYVLQSRKNGRYYVGSTIDIARRLQEHGQGFVKATRFIRPLELKLFVECATLKMARKTEYRLKKYKTNNIIEKLIASGVFPWEYDVSNKRG
ncbi:MAG TPA: GIY-YIG nuclease family protein, partial [Candidatus Paceibacterota bacterium]|nr:GIY-YIG nuclease family protein [Candidatus Paceibacterota bacterium]